MTKLDLKVNAIYCWRNNEHWIVPSVLFVFSILLFPITIILLIWIWFKELMEYDDRKWCRRHHIQYPKQLGHKAHSQVKDWKKIVREETKEEIRKELLSNATKT